MRLQSEDAEGEGGGEAGREGAQPRPPAPTEGTGENLAAGSNGATRAHAPAGVGGFMEM